MKKRKVLSLICSMMILVLLVSACAKKDSSKETASNAFDVEYDMPAAEASYGTNQEADNKDKYDTGTAEITFTDVDGLSSTSSVTTDVSSNQTQDKIIRTFYMDVETQEFDSLITQISSEVSRLEGYVESSKVSGKSYYSEGARYSSIIARIPRENVDEFVNTVDDNANVVNKSEDTDNVSLQYIEAESRVETLKIEQERLFVILEKEVSLENIITLESRLSDIRYELQNYESQLRFYDNQVEFSTVTLSIQEVEKLTNVAEVKQTVGTRIKNGFGDTMYNLNEGLKNFFVWFIVNLPYLLIWSIMIAVIALIIRKSIKKQKAKDAKLPPPSISYLNQNTNQQNQGPNGQA